MAIRIASHLYLNPYGVYHLRLNVINLKNRFVRLAVITISWFVFEVLS